MFYSLRHSCLFWLYSPPSLPLTPVHLCYSYSPGCGAQASLLGATPLKTNSPPPTHSFSVRGRRLLPTMCWKADWLVLVQVSRRQPQLLRAPGCSSPAVSLQPTPASGCCSLSGPSSWCFLCLVGYWEEVKFFKVLKFKHDFLVWAELSHILICEDLISEFLKLMNSKYLCTNFLPGCFCLSCMLFRGLKTMCLWFISCFSVDVYL